jgi:hypothetical protein
MRDPLLEFATVPPILLHPVVITAREPLRRIVADLLAVPDSALERPSPWRPTDVVGIELRYGLYGIHERFEAAIGTIEVERSAGDGAPIGPAVPALAAMAAARWELHGALAPLGPADWDADPGGGEWTIRQTVGHIISGQRSYGWYNAWYLREGVVGVETVRPSEDRFPPEPSEEDEGAGAPAEVLARLDEVVDANAGATAGLDAAAMQVSARWNGLPVTIDVRLGRYESHIREHTVQIDKTFAMLDRRSTEVERLVRLILTTYGRLEARFVGRGTSDLERPFTNGISAVEILDAAIADGLASAARVRAQATA